MLDCGCSEVFITLDVHCYTIYTWMYMKSAVVLGEKWYTIGYCYSKNIIFFIK